MVGAESVSVPQKIVLKQDRWLCIKGHRHHSKEKADRCDGFTKNPRPKKINRNNPPPGFLNTEQARDLFWDADVDCSRTDITQMAKRGVLVAHRAYLPNGPVFVSEESVRGVITFRKDLCDLLGVKRLLARVDCPVCSREVSISAAGKVRRHGGISPCTGTGQHVIEVAQLRRARSLLADDPCKGPLLGS